ncbi:MAG: SHOCT domain-containing protein [Bacteroidota bacterium]|nr:SHOCT domain-containing protein [Bacteroidota bacterium]
MENPASPLETLRQLKEMLDSGALTPTEFEALKQRLVFSSPPALAATEPLAAVVPPVAPPPAVAPVASEPAAPLPPAVPLATEPPHVGWPERAAVASPDSLFLPGTTPDVPVLSLQDEHPDQETHPFMPETAPETDLPGISAARSSSLGLVLAIAGVLVFLAVVAYLGFNRPPSEHLSSTSQTAADSLNTTIETGPQAALSPIPTAEPETVRLAPAHPAPALPSPAEMARKVAATRDSAETSVSPAADSAGRQ